MSHFQGGGGSTVDMCREPHAVKMSHLSAAFTCQVVPSLGGGFHCRCGGGGGGGACVGSLMQSRCPIFRLLLPAKMSHL